MVKSLKSNCAQSEISVLPWFLLQRTEKLRNRPRGNHSCVRWQRLSYLLLCCLGLLISQKSLFLLFGSTLFHKRGSLSELWLYLQHKWLCNGLLFSGATSCSFSHSWHLPCLHVFPWQDAAQLIVQEETKPAPLEIKVTFQIFKFGFFQVHNQSLYVYVCVHMHILMYATRKS